MMIPREFNEAMNEQRRKKFNMNNIQDALNFKSVTQTELCEKIDKSFNMVNSYCRNRRQPSIKVLFEIAKSLEIPASDLINDNYLG